MEGRYILLKKITNSKYFSVYLDYQNKFNLIGYSVIPIEISSNIYYSDKFKVTEVKDGKATLRSSTNKLFTIESLHFNLFSTVFTFPHLKNPEGIIENIHQKENQETNILLLNNMFHSLGILLIELLFKNDFRLRYNDISDHFESSINLIQNRIIHDTSLSEYKKKTLDELLFGNSTSHGLINKDYINYPRINFEFENIIKKVQILKMDK